MMKKAKVRPLQDADRPGVGALRALTFPYLPEVRDVEFYEAVYRWLDRHPLAGKSHRWVAATEDGEVVGHLSAMPQYYRIDGRRVVAHTPGDYMTRPDHGFQALMLMRKFFATCENCVSVDMVPEAIGVQARMGATVAGQLWYTAKLLDVSRLPMPSLPAPVERLLSPAGAPPGGHPESGEGMEQPPNPEGDGAPALRPRAPIPAPVKVLLNGGLRAVDEAVGGLFAGGPQVKVLDGFDESFDVLFEKVAASTFCVPEKDSAFLRWRYGPGSPQAPVTVLGVRDGAEGLLGYAVLRSVAGGQDGYILDLVALPGRQDVARALLFACVRHFRNNGAHIIRYRFSGLSTSPASADLPRLGFFHRNDRRNTLMVRFADPDLHEKAIDVARWSYSIGDGEATFWLRDIPGGNTNGSQHE